MRMTSLGVMWAATETRVLRSTDAGRSWSDVTPANSPGSWSTFVALDDSAAWAIHSVYGTNSLTVERTVDGGRTWSRSAATTPGGGATGAGFVDRLHGWLFVDLGVAAGSEAVAVLSTRDGGATWKVAAQSDDPTSGAGTGGISFGCDKAPMAFGSAAIGLLPTECAGGPPYIYRTADGGAHWTRVNLPGAGYYFETPIFLTATDAVIHGTDGTGGGLLATHDAGASWSLSRLPGKGSIDFESTVSGWQMNDTLFSTSDGGRTWRTIASLPFKGTDMTLQYLGGGIGVAWTSRNTSAYRTDDYGRTWRSIAPSGLHT